MQLTPEILIGSLIGLLGSALYGLSVVVYRSQAKEIRPVAISAIKMWVAFPFMLVMVLLLPGIESVFLPLTVVLILGTSVILGAVVGDTIYLWSQERIGVSYAFPISMSFPIITYFLTVIFLGEPPVLSRLFGALIAVTGVILLSKEQNNNGVNSENAHRFDMLGVAGALTTAILYAVGTTLLQVGIEGVDPISGSFVRIIFGSIAFMPIYAVASYQGMVKPTKKATFRVTLAGFFGMAVGSLLYVAAVAAVGAAIMSVIASTAPIFAIPVSIFFLKERLTWVGASGIVATILGVILVVIGV